ncbi:molybdate ABC transporter permease subunit [soil metagenome]
MNPYLIPLWLSLKLAAITTFILLILSIPLAYWLAITKSWLKYPIQIVTTLPIVLPPTVLGYYLLLLLGSHGILGQFWHSLTGENALAFTFPGLVVGSIIYSLPFAVQPLLSAFEANGMKYSTIAMTLGASSLDRLFSITLPLAQRGMITALILSFAHTVGEFGVVLMIGGNIHNKTNVASIAIYEAVEQMDYYQANLLSLILIGLSVVVLLMVFFLNKNKITQGVL